MYIAYQSSEKFSKTLEVSLISLLENNKKIDYICVFIITNDMTDFTKNKLMFLASTYTNCDICFIKMFDFPLKFGFKYVPAKSSYSSDSFCRMFLGSLLPSNVDKVLFLDADTLVNNDLSELFDLNISKYLFAGCSDALSKSYYNYLGIGEEDAYCNSGSILFNLDLYRKMTIETKVVSFMNKNNGYVLFSEQSVLNIVCRSKILIISPRYNVLTIYKLLSYKQIIDFRHPVNWYSEQEISDAIKNPVIVHATSCFYIAKRPWYNNSDHPYSGLFCKYASLVNDFKYEIYNPKLSSKIKNAVCHMLPKSLIFKIAGFVYNNIRLTKYKLKCKYVKH